MSIKLNTTGYITSIGEKESFGDNQIKLRVSYKTEREQYTNKYDPSSKSEQETKYYSLNCVAYGKIAEYIYSNYNKLKKATENSDVRVELYGHLEADVYDTKASNLKFISKIDGERDKYNISIDGFDDDLYYRTTITRLLIKEITFIDIERVKKTPIGGNSIRQLRRNAKEDSENKSDLSKEESSKDVLETIYDQDY